MALRVLILTGSVSCSTPARCLLGAPRRGPFRPHRVFVLPTCQRFFRMKYREGGPTSCHSLVFHHAPSTLFRSLQNPFSRATVRQLHGHCFGDAFSSRNGRRRNGWLGWLPPRRSQCGN